MNIIVKDKKTGKQFKIVGHDNEFMIYRKAEGEIVDGKLMTKNGKEMKNEWVHTGLYPTTFPSAVYYCMNMILANSNDDEDTVHIEADKVRIKLGKIFKDRLDQIVTEINTEE